MSESLLTLEELVAAVKGEVISKSRECFFTSVQTDSRNVEKDTLFVPLVGEFQNGHKYIPQALDKGASVVFVNRYDYGMQPGVYKRMCMTNPYTSIILVENTLHALQDAAEAYVAKFTNLTKISITGSCGKTTTKEMLVSVFKAKYGDKVVYTKGNFNSETGLPLSVFNIRDSHEIGIFEMGMNRVNEIGEISKVLKSHYGIITNIGTAHIGILGSRENIANEKRKSFDYITESGAAFVPAEDDFADYCTQNCKGKVIKYGKSVSGNGVKFIEDCGLFGTKFSVDGVEINLPLSGEYNYSNALGVVACARELGLTASEIKAGLENMSAVSGRMEAFESVLKCGKKVTVIKDCYNANPDSMGKVIDFCANLKDSGKKIFVLGDMKELGEKSAEAHKNIGLKVNDVENCVVFLVGPEMQAAFEVSKNDLSTYWFAENDEKTFAEIAELINENAEENGLVMLKGSHSMALENLIPLMIREDKE